MLYSLHLVDSSRATLSLVLPYAGRIKQKPVEFGLPISGAQTASSGRS